MEEITIITTSTAVTNSYQIDIVFHEVIIQTLRSDQDIRDLIHNSSSLYDAGNASHTLRIGSEVLIGNQSYRISNISLQMFDSNSELFGNLQLHAVVTVELA